MSHFSLTLPPCLSILEGPEMFWCLWHEGLTHIYPIKILCHLRFHYNFGIRFLNVRNRVESYRYCKLYSFLNSMASDFGVWITQPRFIHLFSLFSSPSSQSFLSISAAKLTIVSSANGFFRVRSFCCRKALLFWKTHIYTLDPSSEQWINHTPRQLRMSRLMKHLRLFLRHRMLFLVSRMLANTFFFLKIGAL